MNKEVGYRWHRLHISADNASIRLNSLISALKWKGMYEDRIGPTTQEQPSVNSDWGRRHDLVNYFDTLQFQHFDYVHPFLPIEHYLLEMAQLGVDFFCGKWRESPAFPNARLDLTWFDELRLSYVAVLLSQMPSELSVIAAYVDSDLPPDEGSWDRTRWDNAFYRMLSKAICGYNRDVQDIRQNELLKCRSKRVNAMLECWDAIETQDRLNLSKAMSKLISIFAQSEVNVDSERIIVSMDATIIWNLAVMRGCACSTLPNELMDFVFTRESLGLAPIQNRKHPE